MTDPAPSEDALGTEPALDASTAAAPVGEEGTTEQATVESATGDSEINVPCLAGENAELSFGDAVAPGAPITPELLKKNKSKKPHKVTADGASEHVDAVNNDNNTTTAADDAQLPSSSTTFENKKSKKRSAKNKSPREESAEAATPNTMEENGSNDASSSENRDTHIPRARGFTAVNLPVASAKPTTPLEDPAMEQLLNESAAAAATEKDADGDVPMEGTVAATFKKHKRKRKDKSAVTEDGDEQEATAPQSAKKRKNKDQPADVVEGHSPKSPESQVPATQDEQPPAPAIDAAEGSGNQGGEETAAPKKKKSKKGKHASPTTDDAQVLAESSEQPAEAEPAASGEPESIPATQLEEAAPPREATPSPSPLLLLTTALQESSPAVLHTPKPKSKVAIAYERKRKRLEAAAAASSSTQAHTTTADGGDGMDLDVPNEEDEDVLTTATPARDTPKTSKRKKRRMPDLNTPSRPIGDGNTSPRSDDEEGEEGAPRADGDAAANDRDPGSSRTPRAKAGRKPKTPKLPKSPKPTSSFPNTPQPGTTALSRKRASYTYAPNPTPATPPSTGTFTQPECATIDNYLQTFAMHKSLTEKQLIARIWGDTSVVSTQTKTERESFWKDLYELFPHRKRLAIYNHVRRRYHNFDVQGAKWDEQQDAALAKMVDELGKKWTNIGRAMGRLPDDCRDRWRNYVKCGQIRREKEWTEEEEAKLRQVVGEVKDAVHQAALIRGENLPAEVEPNWTVVSEKMGGWRSRIQCRYKWSKMLEWEGKDRLPDEEGGEAEGENGVRKAKTPRKRRKSAAARPGGGEQSQVQAFPEVDEVPIDPALADHVAPVAPMAHTSTLSAALTTLAGRKVRGKKTAASSGRKSKASAAADAATSTPQDAEDSDTITILAAQQMLTGDRIWLLESILEYDPETPGSIPWEELARKAPHKQWTARGLERAFGRIVKKGISRKDREGLGVVEGVKRLLGELEELPEGVRAERWTSPVEGEEVEGAEVEGGEVVVRKEKGRKSKGKNKEKEGGKKKGRKPKAKVGAGQDEDEGGELRSAVRQAVESIKEREETEKFASLLLSSVQEAYAAQ